MPLVGQALRVGRVGEHGRGQVRAAHRLSLLLARLDRGGVDLEAQLAQPRGHRVGAPPAVRARVEQALGQQRAAVVDPVAEHVKVLVGAVDRRDLRGRHHPDAVQRSGGQRLVDTVDGVVVGQGKQLHPGESGILDHLRGRQLTVGEQGVRLQVEERAGHARKRT